MFSLFKKSKERKPDIARQDEFGYLGKTELRPDFIKYQVNSRESIALDHWVKEGFSYASRQSATTGTDNSNFGLTNLFFMAGNDSETSLLGMITPSLDSSGRHYPFASFVNIGQELYRVHPSALFLNESNDFIHLSERANAIFMAQSELEMQQEAQKLTQMAHVFKSSTSINQLLEKFRNVPMSDLWQATGIDDEQTKATLIQESALLMQSIANRGCLRTQVGLRFPMPKLSEGFELIAAFWLHLVTVIVADHNWRPWVFYQTGSCGQPASLTVFTTPVPPSFFDAIWSSKCGHQTVIDFATVSPSEPLQQEFLSLAKADNVSMYDALRRWCKA
ncbi:type VI secretion system-associated protein TagF [Thalassotalea euphylliae]|uniref:Type VI secretion system-associated protein TagF n=1 Tax=Thalassotalea euphylliae TaxID=1655234 RepID=A0A3E0TQL6_9GAMM|nr:type VI secretion system-associated protein TagF [Thalassotalea euphylliae]REL26630.1 type VI secretion system-associated protein TagF [Thalassotalea euphylliae]